MGSIAENMLRRSANTAKVGGIQATDQQHVLPGLQIEEGKRGESFEGVLDERLLVGTCGTRALFLKG